MEKCDAYQWTCTLVSDPVLGWLAWASSIVTLIAFAVTLYQISQLKSSAKRAEAALAKAGTHIDGTNLAYVSSQLSSVKNYIHSSRLDAASAIFSPMMRTIRLHGAARKISEIETASLNRAIGQTNEQINLAINNDTKYKSQIALKNIEALLEIVTAWESDLIAKNREEISK